MPPSLPSLAAALLSARARRAWRVLLVLLVALVCWLAFDPDPPPSVDSGWDKGNHALAFAVLTGNSLLAFRRSRRRNAACAIGLLAFGGVIELVQSQIPGRSAEGLDLLADAAGIGLGLLAAGWLQRRLRS